jgi:FkbM family methyltransferase
MELLTQIAGSLPRSWITGVARLQFRFPLLKKPVGWLSNRFRHRNGKIQKGEGRGLRFNPGSANAGYLLGTSEPAMQFALARLIRPTMTVYDIGANVGFFSVIAARLVGPHGRVIAFEALPENAEQLVANALLNNFENIIVRCEALGNENGFTAFFAADESTLGRLKTLGPPDPAAREITVPVRQLDRLIAGSDLPLPGLVKLDVEGAEVAVLLGACET